jgi:hypothetical protein
LFSKRRRLGVPAGKAAGESCKLGLRGGRTEVNAGNSGGGQQLRETALARGCSERHAIEQNLIPRRTQQQSTAAALVQRGAQFLPGGIELIGCPHMPKLVQPRELEQNIQAAHKCSGRRSCIAAHS